MDLGFSNPSPISHFISKSKSENASLLLYSKCNPT